MVARRQPAVLATEPGVAASRSPVTIRPIPAPLEEVAMRRLTFGGLTLFAALALAACGGAASPPAASQPAASEPAASEPAASEPVASEPVASEPAAATGCEPSTDAATVNTTIADFTFAQPVTAKVGDVVGWKNDDTTAHSVVLDDGSCQTDNIDAGASLRSAVASQLEKTARGSWIGPATEAGIENLPDDEARKNASVSAPTRWRSALENGTGSELRFPLGVTIIGGLLLSQLLTLYTTPVIYIYMERFRVAMGRATVRTRTALGLRGPHPVPQGGAHVD